MYIPRHSPRLFLRVLSLVAGSGLVTTPAAQAQTVIVGNNGTGNLIPFSSLYAHHYQQIYSATAFGGPVTIRQIGFLSKSAPCAFSFTGNLGLGTTLATPSSPGNSFDANKGADFQNVFSGTQTATLMTNDTFDLLFDVTPFVYNPAAGNLVLDVFTDAVTRTDLIDFAAGLSSLEGRLFTVPNSGTAAVFSDVNYGLRTQFVVSPSAQATPEPTSLAYFLALLVTGGVIIQRRRK